MDKSHEPLPQTKWRLLSGLWLQGLKGGGWVYSLGPPGFGVQRGFEVEGLGFWAQEGVGGLQSFGLRVHGLRQASDFNMWD